MKKTVFSIVVTAALLLAVGFVFTACDTGTGGGGGGDGNTPTSLSGTTWQGSVPGEEGMTTSTIVFTTTTVGTITQDGMTIPFTYTYNPSSASGTITVTGDSGTFTVKGNTLTVGGIDYKQTK
jgi:hypothetical protein